MQLLFAVRIDIDGFFKAIRRARCLNTFLVPA